VHARGFTLVELVLAVTLLAAGVLAVAASAVPLGRLVRRGDARVAAAAAAGAEIEAVRAAGCSAPASGVASAGQGLRMHHDHGGQVSVLKGPTSVNWDPYRT